MADCRRRKQSASLLEEEIFWISLFQFCPELPQDARVSNDRLKIIFFS